MHKHRIAGLVAAPALLVLIALAVSSSRSAQEEPMADHGPLVGGISDVPQNENDEHNKKANALLAYEKLVKAKTQVVAGTMYYLTVEAKDGEAKKLYEAKVWEKPWENFKELQEFKPVEESSA
ncbi:unnamed protein product [Urochloa humidicola]